MKLRLKLLKKRMDGIKMKMDKTTECNYITPCGWCEKWDKKCDLKVKEATQFKLKELELEKNIQIS